jgi:cytochrome P450
LAHPDHVHEVLVRQARHVRKATRFKRVFGRFEGAGLVTGDGDAWADLRRRVQPAFQPAALAGVAEAARRLAARAFDGWPVPGVIDLSAEMTRLAVRVTAAALFATDADDLADELAAAGPARQRWAHRELNRVVPTPRWFPLLGRPRRARALLRRLAERVLRGGPRPGIDGLGRDQLVGLLLAGYETTAVALAWAGWLLARHPAVQDQVAADPDGPAADRAFREALRLYPPVHLFSREVAEPVTVSGYELPAGGQVFVSPYLTQRDPRWFPDPDRFDPDRFTPEAETARPACAWFPFGAGPRACVGRGAALAVGSAVLSLLAARFRLEPTADPEAAGELFLVPQGGVRVTVRARVA